MTLREALKHLKYLKHLSALNIIKTKKSVWQYLADLLEIVVVIIRSVSHCNHKSASHMGWWCIYIYIYYHTRTPLLDDSAKTQIMFNDTFLHPMAKFLKFLLSEISAHGSVMVKVWKTLWLWQINSIIWQLKHLVKIREMDVKWGGAELSNMDMKVHIPCELWDVRKYMVNVFS